MVGKLDTTYIPTTACAILEIRPAQFMTSPMVQHWPTETITAAGKMYLGIDPAEVDEIDFFYDGPNPMAMQYGAAIKFNKPFRAISIPPQCRAHAQLAEFNGKKYLQSAHPFLPSFYGPNNKTLLLVARCRFAEGGGIEQSAKDRRTDRPRA